MEENIDDIKNQLEEEKNKYLYLLADFKNMKSRLTQQIENEKKFKNKGLFLKLIEVIDDCERSLEYNNNESPIFKKLYSILLSENVKKIDIEIGDEFDVSCMQAISQTKGNDDIDNNCVSCIMKNGYTYNGQVIRFASVMVENKD